MRKKPKRKFSLPVRGVVEIEGEDATAFEAWLQNTPSGLIPEIKEWSFRVEIAKGIRAQVKMTVPSWDKYREAEAETK